MGESRCTAFTSWGSDAEETVTHRCKLPEYHKGGHHYIPDGPKPAWTGTRVRYGDATNPALAFEALVTEARDDDGEPLDVSFHRRPGDLLLRWDYVMRYGPRADDGA